MSIFLIILSSVWLGININVFYTGLRNRISEKKKFNEKNKHFSEILSNITSEPVKAKFKSRVNNTIYISTKLKDKGDVDLIYLMDKNDIAIFKNDDCIYTSENVDKETVDKIMQSVGHVFSNEINDVVNILGFTFDRPEFEKSFGVKMEDVKKMMSSFTNSITQDDSEIDKIYHENQMRFDIDEILDRINIVGIKNLTKAELEFLRKYSKK